MSGDLSRRDFNRLTAAAFGGIVAGSIAGCAKEEPKPAASTPAAGTPATSAAGDPPAVTAAVEKHACRGLNSCKTDKNACAGQSACATVSHECATMNDCKYQGGCGENPGSNECKGMGDCHVPMKPEHGAWEKARMAFEERMKAQKKEFGKPPEPAATSTDATKES